MAEISNIRCRKIRAAYAEICPRSEKVATTITDEGTDHGTYSLRKFKTTVGSAGERYRFAGMPTTWNFVVIAEKRCKPVGF